MATQPTYQITSAGLEERPVRSEEVMWLRRHPLFGTIVLLIQDNMKEGDNDESGDIRESQYRKTG